MQEQGIKGTVITVDIENRVRRYIVDPMTAPEERFDVPVIVVTRELGYTSKGEVYIDQIRPPMFIPISTILAMQVFK